MEPASLLVRFGAPDVAMPTNTAPLQAALVAHDVRDAFATYWIAYRTTFESGGRVAVTAYARQYPPWAGAVRTSNDPAYIFVTTSATLGRFESWCARTDMPVPPRGGPAPLRSCSPSLRSSRLRRRRVWCSEQQPRPRARA